MAAGFVDGGRDGGTRVENFAERRVAGGGGHRRMNGEGSCWTAVLLDVLPGECGWRDGLRAG